MKNDILLKLKVELLLYGIDFSEEKTLLWLKRFSNGLKEPSHGLFNYHDSDNFVPNEIIATLFNDSIRIETRNNKNSKLKLEIIKNKAYINYAGEKINIKIEKLPEFLSYVSPKGILLNKYINIMGEDCLRIYPKLFCDFNVEKLKCKFCGIDSNRQVLNDKDLLDEYIWAFGIAYKFFKPKYIFISTGTHLKSNEIGFFIKFFKYIKTIDKNILNNTIFVPAPNISYSDIDRLYSIGIGMLSFNIELWDENLFEKYCPGKHKTFGRQHYINLIKYCSDKYGKNKVKTNFVLGLESLKQLKYGIRALAQMNCYSSGTIFYPTPGAILDKNYQNKNIKYYLKAYKYIDEMATKHDLKTPWARENRISGLEWDIKTDNCKKNLNYKKPSRLIIELTDRCNLNCIHCFANKFDKELNYKDWQRIIKRSIKDNIDSISITGGEPLLYPNIFKIFEGLDVQKTKITLDTNGVLINETNVKLIKKYFKLVRISIYGVKDEDSYEITKNPVYNYQKVLNKIELLSKSGVKIQINIPLFEENIEFLPKIFLDLSKFNIYEIVLIPILKIGLAKNIKRTPSDKKIKKIYNLYHKCLKTKLRLFKWAEGKHFLVRSDGKVFLHPFYNNEHQDFYLGNILEKSIEELWKKVEKKYKVANFLLTPSLDDF